MNRKLVFLMVFLIVICTGSISLIQPSSGPTLGDDVKVGLYYYVWYEEGNGSRHWNDELCNTAVDKPILGYYSSQNETIIKQHLDWMKDLGIDFLIVSWWGNGDSPFGGNSYEDESCKFIFSIIKQCKYPIKAALMVEGFNESGTYNFPSIFDYINETYVTPYADVYMTLNNKPLLCWYNAENMTGTLENPKPENINEIRNDSRFESRIVGHNDYVDWWFAIPCTANNSTIPPSKDGMICVEPRYDDQFLGRDENSTFDGNLTEGLYDFQWREAIRLAEEGEVNYVTIYSWNEYHERSQIEPHIGIDGKHILSLFCETRNYVQTIKKSPLIPSVSVDKALDFVEAQLNNYDDDKWLCREFPDSYRYWIYNDNYLAYMILDYFNRSESANRIKTAIESYGISLEGNDRLEVLVNQTIPFPPYAGAGMNYSPIIDSYQNLITNPSVEIGDPFCDDWYYSTTGAYWSNQEAYTGCRSLLLNVSDDSADWRCKAFKVLANITYVFQGWTKGSASKGEFFVTLRWWRDAEATDFISEENIPIPLGHYEKWTLFENETTAPSETMAADVQFRCPTNSTGELFGDDFLVINISNEESFIVRNDEKHLQKSDWKEYADLLLFGVIDRYYRENSAYKDLWNEAYTMFDGKGMADKAFNGTRYETYKLALFVIASRIINNQTMATNCALNIIWKMQDESNGGVTTHYLPDLTPDPHSTQNIETTCLAIYSTIPEVIPEFPSFLILPLFMIATLLAAMIYRRSAPIHKSFISFMEVKERTASNKKEGMCGRHLHKH